MGVFVYRSANGSGSNAWTNMKIRWNYGTNGVADDASLEIKLFGLEMVYVPQGSFYIGDGNGTTASSYAFNLNATHVAVNITTALTGSIRVDAGGGDDAQIYNIGVGVDGDGGIDVDNNGTIDNPAYPTGYTGFYMMKYEASQEEYVDFLNTLTRTQQAARVAITISGTSPSYSYAMSNGNVISYRNGIRCPSSFSASLPITFFCDLNNNAVGNEAADGQNIACNYVSWPDLCAYADWAGLRPGTELEYEKACRGPNPPVPLELAWGTATYCSSTYSVTNSGMTNEMLTGFCTGTGNAGWAISFPAGPLRTGIFAASVTNKNRIETGTGYYGNAELTGNVNEQAVSLGNVAGRSYTGIHGNGKLNVAGDADVDYWPGINGNSNNAIANTIYGGTTGVTNAAGAGLKLGNFNWNIATVGHLSDRQAMSSGSSTRGFYYGMRLVRTAP
jgi:formylglycine-generating enzyme required for sulfatase activity